MPDIDVRIEKLPAMQVAWVCVFGEAPEPEAWRRLREWAVPHALWGDLEQHPIFGFNNPSPSAGVKEYGYELWIRVDAQEEPRDEVAYKQFEGGLFAVTSCRLPDIFATWRRLWDWTQTSAYRWRRAQELEKALNPDATEVDMILELYLPIEQR